MPEVPASVLHNRPNKLAIGMTKTSYRQGNRLSDVACALSVKGTTDILARRVYFNISAPSICECCGNRNYKRRVLSETGKRKLLRLRRKYAQL